MSAAPAAVTTTASFVIAVRISAEARALGREAMECEASALARRVDARDPEKLIPIVKLSSTGWLFICSPIDEARDSPKWRLGLAAAAEQLAQCFGGTTDVPPAALLRAEWTTVYRDVDAGMYREEVEELASRDVVEPEIPELVGDSTAEDDPQGVETPRDTPAQDAVASPSIAPGPTETPDGATAERQAPAEAAPAISPEGASAIGRRNVDWLLRTFQGTQHVAAINPDTGAIHCLTFTAEVRDKAEAFLSRHAAACGLYYQPNEVRSDLGPNRATKADIARVRAIYADVDPQDTATRQPGGLQRERERIRAEGCKREDDPRTRPSYVVSSGRGEQIGYVLEKPIRAGEVQDRAENLARGMLRSIGTAESTSDITRLMRLPYGLNHPNATKRAQGHVTPVPTGLAFESETRWTFEALEAIYAPVARSKKRAAAGVAESEIDMAAVEDISCYDELPEKLRAKLDLLRQENAKLDALWGGTFPPDTPDTSGSNFAMFLAMYLRPTGKVSATEYGQLLYSSDHSSNRDKMDARYIARAWSKAPKPKPDAGEELGDTTGGATTAAGIDTTDWPHPVDLWNDEGPPTTFPENVLPSIVQRFAVDRARRLGVFAGAVAAPAVVAFGSLVPSGNRIHMRQLSDSWAVRCILWTAIVGPPGSAKSPALSAALEPVRVVEAEWRREYAKAKEAHDAAYPPKEPRTRRKRAKASPDEQAALANDQGADDLFDSAASSVSKIPPVLRQKTVNDTTTEALIDVLAANPSGVLCAADELAGWLAGMDAYKARAGKDRAIWLQAKDGDAYTVNRKGSGVTCVEHNAVSLAGTIQDDKLAAIASSLTDDGLQQRIALIAITRDGDGEDIPDDVGFNQSVARAALNLAELDTADYRLSPEAAAELKAMQKFRDEEINRIDIPPALRNWLDKTPNEFGRYCLAFHMIDWASSFAPAIEQPPAPLVPRETAIQARRYIQEFLYPHARYVYGTIMAHGIGDEHARWIAGFLLAYKHESIRARQVARAYKALGSSERRGQLLSAMAKLEAMDWLRVVTPGQQWKVNPKAHEEFAERGAAELKRRLTVRATIAEDGSARSAEKGGAA